MTRSRRALTAAAIGWAALVWGAFAGAGGPELPIEFDAEVVRLRVEADTLLVEGLYRFALRPGSPERITLFFPYPRDSLMGEARTLLLEARSAHGGWQPQSFEELPGNRGARWELALTGADTIEVRTIYWQHLFARHARYIVTTTSAWGRPLRHARFELCLPAGARPVEFSHPFHPMAAAPGCHVFEAGPFLPRRDIEVRWTRPE